MRWWRLRKWAKRTYTLAAGAALALAVYSGFRQVRYAQVSSDGKTARGVWIHGGRFGFEVWRGYDISGSPISLGWSIQESVAWSWGMNDQRATTRKWRGGFMWYGPVGQTCLWGGGVTLLYPVLVTTIPAALLWYADRHSFRPGLCPKCGYDRHGLASDARCPECGTAPTPTQA